VRYGYRRLHVLLRREGWRVIHKRIYRLYRLEGLLVRSKVHKKRVSALRPLLPAAHRHPMSNGAWTERRERTRTDIDANTPSFPDHTPRTAVRSAVNCLF
jgi:transposase InsO family protein